MRKLRVHDLFSGIGAFSLGLERTGGFETLAFSEVDPRAVAVLRNHWPTTPQLGDVTTAHFDRGAADVLTAGFPCQDLSLAGDGSGLAGPRSGLVREVIRAVRLVRPLVVLLENVAALLGRGMGAVLGALAQEGYDAEWDCVRAFDAGAPHVRDRLWIAAYSAENGWGPGRPGGLADGLAGLPVEPCWSGDPVACFEERFAQPALLGVGDEAPRGLDRLGLCGNALIADIPEAIGRAILAAQADATGEIL